MYTFLKFILFRFSAERAHHITTTFFGILCRIPLVNEFIGWVFRFDHPSLERNFWGLKFKNPVGLAAGFDKDGKYIASMSKLGFGFIEVGTVTPRPQIGNPKPRLFRLKDDRGIINRMGFNNEGVDILVDRLRSLPPSQVIIGGNIGKNKDTPNEEAYKDYLICFEKLYPFVDYFVVNISSPNTPGLRALQEKEPLKKILQTLLDFRKVQSQSKPVLLKIAPDLTPEQLADVLEIVQEMGIEGIIATNTTIARSPLSTPDEIISEIGAGGLSGDPLRNKATEMVQDIKNDPNFTAPIIGVGGISDPASAHEKIKAGASLIQVYSGLIYEGPFLVKNIKKHLAKYS